MNIINKLSMLWVYTKVLQVRVYCTLALDGVVVLDD